MNVHHEERLARDKPRNGNTVSLNGSVPVTFCHHTRESPPVVFLSRNNEMFNRAITFNIRIVDCDASHFSPLNDTKQATILSEFIFIAIVTNNQTRNGWIS